MAHITSRRKRRSRVRRTRRPRHTGLPYTRRLRVEPLERRALLDGTTFVVDSLADVVTEDGFVTLREAIMAANDDAPVGDAPAGSGDDTITFDPGLFTSGPQTLTISGEQIEVDGGLTITGPGKEWLTMDGTGVSPGRAFGLGSYSSNQFEVSLSALTFQGGAVRAFCPVTFNDVDFLHDGSTSIYFTSLVSAVETTVEIRDCTFASSAAGPDPPEYPFSGIMIENANLIARRCEFRDLNGAGILLDGGNAAVDDSQFSGLSEGIGHELGGGRVWVTGCEFEGNGGGVTAGYIRVEDSVFRQNGGGYSISAGCVSGTDVTINGSTFEENLAGVSGISVTFNRSTFRGNAWGVGGEQIDVTDSTFTENVASYAIGGGQVTVARTFITDNDAAGVGVGDGVSEIVDCDISHNTGEGIYAPSGDGKLTVRRTAISYNGRTGIVARTRDLDVIDSTIAGNNLALANGWGGGIEGGHTVAIIGSTIHDNAAEQGGGIHWIEAQNGTLTIVNSTISGNRATTYGGGMYLWWNQSPWGAVVLRNTTVVGNSAQSGGGVYGAVIAYNSIFAGNTNSDLSGVGYGTLYGEYNLVQDPHRTYFDGSHNIIGQDPLLGPLADNGGPTWTHAPLPGSPVIDAGDPDFDPLALDPPLSTDQRGLPRLDTGGAGRVDLGAVETHYPGAATDVYSTEAGVLLAVNSPGVLANDWAGGGPLVASLAQAPANGSVSLYQGGSFRYTPKPGFAGTDRFTYYATEGDSQTNRTTVLVQVGLPRIVRDIRAGLAGSGPSSLIELDGTLFFHSDDGPSSIGVWRSDGTQAGTTRLEEMRFGLREAVAVGGALYSPVYDRVYGSELRMTDGTEAGTLVVKDILPGSDSSSPKELTNVGGILCFTAIDGTHGRELWKSDGTEAGTVMVKDIAPGEDSAAIEGLTAVGDTLFFVADDGAGGQALWKSDGTEAGTVMVKDLNPDSMAETFRALTAAGGTLFFVADDAIHGEELWTSDGTEAGTAIVKDLAVGEQGSGPEELTVLDDVLFFTAEDGSTGRGLWITDGTEAGTAAVDLTDGQRVATDAEQLTAVGDVVFLVARDTDDRWALWKTDGTGEGTALVKEVAPFGANSYSQLANAGGMLYFSADDGEHGWELWKSDGTAAGTTMVADLHSGPLSSRPEELLYVNGMLFFVAENGTAGRELYALETDDAFAAFGDLYATQEDAPLQIAAPGGVLANDLSSGGETVTAVLVDDVQHGTLNLGTDGSFEYQAAAGYHGSESFTYRATRLGEPSNLARVAIEVAPVDEARIQGTLFDDLDADGLRDAEEGPLEGWTVQLRKLGRAGEAAQSFYVYGSGQLGASVAFFGDDVLASRSGSYGNIDDPAVYRFDSQTGELLHRYSSPEPGSGDRFGENFVVFGETIAVSAQRGDGGAGVVYVLDGQSGEILRTIHNPTPDAWDEFGSALAVSGDRLLVSAASDDTTGPNAGAAYLFDLGTGELLQTLLDPVLGENHGFGNSLALTDDFALIGASGSSANPDDPGTVYVFDSATGALARIIENPSPDPKDYFGGDLALADGSVLVGASGEDADGPDTGVAYLFDIRTGQLLRTFHSPTPEEGDRFGMVVELTSEDALVGVPYQGSYGDGAVFVFDSRTGMFLQRLDNPTGDANSDFGRSIAVAGERVLVGAPQDEKGGMDGGAAYLFNVQQTAITDPDGQYEFPDLPPGDYRVRLAPPDGYAATAPAGGEVFLTLGEDEVRTGVEFGATADRPPVAGDDGYCIGQDAELVVTADEGVLANDADPEDDPMTAVLLGAPGHGTVVLNEDGSFTYTPEPGYAGTDAFTYRASDGLLHSGVATVGLTVAAPPSLDVDGNGAADALTDGVVILRHLFGFTGGPLVEDALAPDAARTDPEEIGGMLGLLEDTMLDVDDNGQADALTDGMLILRYLFGFRGAAMVEDAIGAGANRWEPGDIEAFLDGFNPGVAGTAPMAPLGAEVGVTDEAREGKPGSDAWSAESRAGGALLALEGPDGGLHAISQPFPAPPRSMEAAGWKYDRPAAVDRVMAGTAELVGVSDPLVEDWPTAAFRRPARTRSEADVAIEAWQRL